jgi:hypothetical protein
MTDLSMIDLNQVPTIKMKLYKSIPDLDQSLFSTDYALWLAGWWRFATEHVEEMERAIDFEYYHP